MALLALLFFDATTITAAPGDLDPTFGNGGIALAYSSQYQLYSAYAMAIQPDGKIVVVGEGSDSSRFHSFVIVRYNPNGSLDTSFKGTDIVITGYGGSSDLAIQTDGKIVVAGTALSNGTVGGALVDSFAIVRYNPDGSLDATFNSSGKVITPAPVGGRANSVAIQKDGKIVVAGEGFDSSLPYKDL